MNDAEDRTPGPGWWIASDGELYPPEAHPDTRALLERAEPVPEMVVDGVGAAPPPSAARRLYDAASNGARMLNEPRPLGPELTIGPPTDDLGNSLHRASMALRRHLGMIAGATLLAIAVGILCTALAAVLEVGVASLGWASLSTIVSLLVRLAQLCIWAWVLLVLVRTWKLIADDEAVELTDVIGLQGFLPFLGTTAVLAPIVVLTGGAIWAFAVVALVLTAGANMSPSAAIGRMLSETCGSAKRFFQTLLIGLLFGAFMLTTVFLSSLVFAQVITGTALTTVSNGFEEASNIRETEATMTMVVGTSLTVVLAVTFGLLLWNLFGLWVAFYTGRLVGRSDR